MAATARSPAGAATTRPVASWRSSPKGLYGGDGNDTVYGEGGNDHIESDAGKDIMNGSGGNDRISSAGDGSYDEIYRESGWDLVSVAENSTNVAPDCKKVNR